MTTHALEDEQAGSRELLAKYGHKGFSATTYCPRCMTPILTWQDTKKLLAAYLEGDIDKCHKIIQGKATAFALFIANNKRMAQLLNYHAIIYPLCPSCAPHSKNRGREYTDVVETNLALGRRYALIVKVGEGELYG